MGLRKKKERKAYEISRRKKTNIEKIDGKGIVRVRNEIRLGRGKIKI